MTWKDFELGGTETWNPLWPCSSNHEEPVLSCDVWVLRRGSFGDVIFKRNFGLYYCATVCCEMIKPAVQLRACLLGVLLCAGAQPPCIPDAPPGRSAWHLHVAAVLGFSLSGGLALRPAAALVFQDGSFLPFLQPFANTELIHIHTNTTPLLPLSLPRGPAGDTQGPDTKVGLQGPWSSACSKAVGLSPCSQDSARAGRTAW